MNPILINEAMNCNKSTTENLYVGLCGTQYVGSDRYACVITEILTPKSVRVAWMSDNDYNNNRSIDSDGRECIYRMNDYVKVSEDSKTIVPAGKVFKLRKNHRWVEEGNGLWSTGAVHFGEADNYRDPSF